MIRERKLARDWTEVAKTGTVHAEKIDGKETGMNNTTNEIPVGGEICAPSTRGKIRQVIHISDRAYKRDSWLVAQKMHAMSAARIDARSDRAEQQRNARRDRRKSG